MSSYFDDETCHCGLPLRVLTSWTPTNPARRFVVCPNRSKLGKKKCGYWEWYDPEINTEWYKMNLYELFILLNPNQRNLLHNEVSCQERIDQLEVESVENAPHMRRCEASLNFWKFTFLAFAMFVLTTVGKAIKDSIHLDLDTSKDLSGVELILIGCGSSCLSLLDFLNDCATDSDLLPSCISFPFACPLILQQH
ncbi:zinc finger C2H2-type/integrase DNA-binding domain-containing protein [Tanacetum coccineum]